MAGYPSFVVSKGESYECYDSGDWGQHPQMDGPMVITAIPPRSDTTGFNGRFQVFFSPSGGMVPLDHPQKRTASRWVKIYGDEIDVFQTGSFQVFWQDWPTSIVHLNPEGFSGMEAWLHDGNPIPLDSQGYCRMSSAYLTVGVADVNSKGPWWSFNPNPSQGFGIGRDGYYAGSHKLGNGFSGTMPGVYAQNTTECALLFMAHLNQTYPSGPHVSTTLHTGPEAAGWNYAGILRPKQAFYTQPYLNWGVCISVWWRYFINQWGYTGNIPWRTNVRDPDYQMQSLILLLRGKEAGVLGGSFG